jgi:signal transduction histidine kinase
MGPVLENLRLAFVRHRKFLAIFFVVIFLPSVILAYFGIRSLHNERYKLQQQTLERQRTYIRSVRTGIASIFDKNASGLKDLCGDTIVSSRDYGAIRESISRRLRDGSLLGRIVLWTAENSSWLPDWQKTPPSAISFRVSGQWRKWLPELADAERAEFRNRDYAGAVSLYERLLSAAADRSVKAWLLARIARCEVKREDFERAVSIHRRVVADYRDIPTESGRPLELVSRLEILEGLLALKKAEDFAGELREAYDKLAKNAWSLDGGQVSAYVAMLDPLAAMAEASAMSLDSSGPNAGAVAAARAAIDEHLKDWRLAETVRQSILPDIGTTAAQPNRKDGRVHGRALEFEGHDILALIAPLGPGVPGGHAESLGSLLRIADLKASIEALAAENRPPDASLKIRSVTSGEIIFGSAEAAGDVPPVVTDIFPENFPPWRLETFRNDGGGAEYSLYQNIFFWIILALLAILFFGSGLIIRTVLQEARLLNLKSDFIASVSHEFKTPLTSIGAILEHLLDGEAKDPKKSREYYRILQHDSDRLKRLVGNVLDFSRIEEGKKTYRLKPADPVELVEREVRSFERESGIEGLAIRVQAEELIPRVAVDEEALGQALHNILDNAVKFSPGEKKIDVAIRNKSGAVEISVEDRGIGIPENELKRIYEKFYRGRQAASVSPTGTGLGLALVKHIMDAHHGDIFIRSRPGEGTSVSLVLPVEVGTR